MKTIKLSQGKETIVDDDIFNKYSQLSWHIKPHGKTFYAKHSSAHGPVYLHRLIMCPKNSEVDHIDGNGLNNLRSNLRVGSHRQNMRNIHVSKTSRYHGVYWNPAAKKWQAYAQHKRKSIYLGVFAREKDAAAKSAAFRRSLPK
jgi:HNH endonuclease